MKKPNNIEKEIDIIRKKLQKEREGLSIEEKVEKSNANAERLAKEYGFKFQTGKISYDYFMPQKTIYISEENAEYNASKKPN